MKILYTIFFILFTGLSSFSQSLIAYYKFDNNVNDSINASNNGTGVDISTFFDRFGNADKTYRIHGISTSKIIIPIQNFLLNSYTYSIWTKVWTLPANGNAAAIICTGEAATANQSLILANNNGTYQWIGISYYNNASGDNAIYSTSTVDTGAWYHLVLTRDSINNSMKLYVNGSNVASNTSLTSNVAAYGNIANADFLVGSRGVVQVLNGQVDDLRIYDYALSNSEVLNLYNQEKPLSTGINEQSLDNSPIIVFPNPSTTGTINLDLSRMNGSAEVKIYNAYGQMLYEKNTDEANVVVRDLEPGVYFCSVVTQDNIHKTVKFTIQ